MKYKKFFVLTFLITIMLWFCTGIIYYLFFFRSYNPVFVRCIYHFYASIILVFAFTFVAIIGKKKIKHNDILWGAIGVASLTVIWEIVVQGISRNYTQWDQVLADFLGLCVAIAFWFIKGKRFLIFNGNLFNLFKLIFIAGNILYNSENI